MRKLCYIPLLILLSACSFQKHKLFWRKSPVPCLKRIVVIRFRPACPIYTGSSYLRCPISENTLRGAKVSDEVLDYITGLLLRRLSKGGIFFIIPPEEVKKEFLDLNESIDSAKGKLLLEYLRQVGLVFNADAVILGHVFRWEERTGSDFAASRPASVAFDMHLVGTEKGKVLWSAEFDKTQMSLSENLLDIKTFIKGKGRWMTAAKLADMGMSNMVNKIFKTQKGCKR